MCNANCLLKCGLCCLLLSGWAVIQLILMGIFYNMEATPLVGDVIPSDYTDYEDFIQKTKKQFSVTAINCWIAAVIYTITGALSFLCIASARKTLEQRAAESDDDEIFCEPPDEPGGPKPTKKKL